MRGVVREVRVCPFGDNALGVGFIFLLKVLLVDHGICQKRHFSGLIFLALSDRVFR